MGLVALPWTEVPGQPNNVNHVMANDQTLRDVINGNIDGANAPALMSHWQVLAITSGALAGSVTAATRVGTFDFGLKSSGVDGGILPTIIRIDAADLVVTGRTPKLRVKAQSFTNGTAPGADLTFGLTPITAAGGGAGVTNITLGTTVAGSTVTRSAPAANSMFSDASAEFAVPADGFYGLSIANSATTAANAVVTLSMQLLVHWVA